MSKVDAMRALREARRAAASAGPAASPRRAVPAARPSAAAASRPDPAVPSADVELCGHRNIAGRSCTRELDHVRSGTKNHRYG